MIRKLSLTAFALGGLVFLLGGMSRPSGASTPGKPLNEGEMAFSVGQTGCKAGAGATPITQCTKVSTYTGSCVPATYWCCAAGGGGGHGCGGEYGYASSGGYGYSFNSVNCGPEAVSTCVCSYSYCFEEVDSTGNCGQKQAVTPAC